MPVYLLDESPAFPPAHRAESDGLLAMGGDLSVERLVNAYAHGIFPWYNEGDPILWWSPDPRMVLEPRGIHISKSLGRTLRQSRFAVTFDGAFEPVIDACATVRGPGREGTWITPAMRRAYLELHAAGLAHSVEAWRDGELAGGLYGVSLGACFFGESMFTRVTDASKVALAALAARLAAWDFELIDCQMETAHLRRMGARPIPRRFFLHRLEQALRRPTRKGSWAERAGNTQ
jgi:leucyl/phenylalanyl-tRNA--protein transferase